MQKTYTALSKKLKHLPWITQFSVALVLALLILGGGIRTLFLQHIPFSYYHDEMDHVFLGESIARYGTDVGGGWSPWSLTPPKTINIVAEITPVFHAAAQLLFGLGPQSGHIPTMLFGFATVILLGYVAWQLSKNKIVALLAAGLLAVNPWHIYISRMAYEGPISLFFQLGIVSVLLHLLDSKNKTNRQLYIQLAVLIVTSFLAFFTYHGAKLTVFGLLGCAMVALGYEIWKSAKQATAHQKTCFKQAIVSVSVILLLTVGLGVQYLYNSNQGLYGHRYQELLTDETFLNKSVNQRRQLSLATPVTQLLVNKGTVFTSEALKRVAFVADIRRLFTTGESGGFQFSLFVHSYFYPLTLVFILIGGGAIFYKRKEALYVGTLLAVGMPASVLMISNQALFRSALTYAILLYIAASGLHKLLLYVQKWRWLTILLGVALCAQTTYFGYIFLTRYPIVAADNHFFEDYQLSRYVQSADTAVVIGRGPVYRYARSIAAYNQLLPEMTEEQRQALGDPSLSIYELVTITVTDKCEYLATSDRPVVIQADMVPECLGDLRKSEDPRLQLAADTVQFSQALSSPIDSRGYFLVTNDPVCQELELPGYTYHSDLASFKLEELSDQQFCQKWMKAE